MRLGLKVHLSRQLHGVSKQYASILVSKAFVTTSPLLQITKCRFRYIYNPYVSYDCFQSPQLISITYMYFRNRLSVSWKLNKTRHPCDLYSPEIGISDGIFRTQRNMIKGIVSPCRYSPTGLIWPVLVFSMHLSLMKYVNFYIDEFYVRL